MLFLIFLIVLHKGPLKHKAWGPMDGISLLFFIRALFKARGLPVGENLQKHWKIGKALFLIGKYWKRLEKLENLRFRCFLNIFCLFFNRALKNIRPGASRSAKTSKNIGKALVLIGKDWKRLEKLENHRFRCFFCENPKVLLLFFAKS